jgi:hypothetical protein
VVDEVHEFRNGWPRCSSLVCRYLFSVSATVSGQVTWASLTACTLAAMTLGHCDTAEVSMHHVVGIVVVSISCCLWVTLSFLRCTRTPVGFEWTTLGRS